MGDIVCARTRIECGRTDRQYRWNVDNRDRNVHTGNEPQHHGIDYRPDWHDRNHEHDAGNIRHQ
jgi:hypothetical protein